VDLGITNYIVFHVNTYAFVTENINRSNIFLIKNRFDRLNQ